MLCDVSQNLYSTALQHGNKFMETDSLKRCSPEQPAALTCEIALAETQHESLSNVTEAPRECCQLSAP